MITSVNHTGFVVSDLEKSVAFYRDIIGLELVRNLERDGAQISHLLGYENTRLKGAMLRASDGHHLELLQYLNPQPSERPTEERASLGASHLAFNVEGLQEDFERLIANGAKQLNPPTQMEAGRSVCYLQDPDGNWIELIESQ